MPSTSPAMARLMAARAHGWAPKHPHHPLPPVSVAKEFNEADKGTKMLSEGMEGHAAGGPIVRCPHCGKHHYAEGGPIDQDIDPLGTLEKDKREVTPEEEPGGLPVYQGEDVKSEREAYLRRKAEAEAGSKREGYSREGYSKGGTVSPVYEATRRDYRRQEDELDDYGRRNEPQEGDRFGQHLLRRRRLARGGMIPRR